MIPAMGEPIDMELVIAFADRVMANLFIHKKCMRNA